MAEHAAHLANETYHWSPAFPSFNDRVWARYQRVKKNSRKQAQSFEEFAQDASESDEQSPPHISINRERMIEQAHILQDLNLKQRERFEKLNEERQLQEGSATRESNVRTRDLNPKQPQERFKKQAEERAMRGESATHDSKNRTEDRKPRGDPATDGNQTTQRTGSRDRRYYNF